MNLGESVLDPQTYPVSFDISAPRAARPGETPDMV